MCIIRYMLRFTTMWIAFSIMLTISTSTIAQSPSFEIVAPDDPALEIKWSTDSQRLAFRSGFTDEMGVTLSDDNWLQYIPSTATLTRHNTWPLQPDLTQAEQQIFNPAITAEGQKSFLNYSPNEHYLVYADAPLVNDVGWIVNIGNRQTGQIVNTSALILDPFYSPLLFETLFSDDSTAFVIVTSDIASQPVIQYVSGYTNAPSSPSFEDLSYLVVDGVDYTSFSAGDLSDDGSKVLLLGYKATGETNLPMEVIVWNVVNSIDSQVLDSFSAVVGASFAPGTENRLLIVTELGLIEYNLSTDTFTVLNSEIRSAWVAEAIFSPDGQWVAFVDIHNNLYVEPTTSP
jgi:hypothetical protein